MGIGRKTRTQAKLHKREVKREQYKAEVLRTIFFVFIIGLCASLVLVKIASLIYPVVSQYAKDFIRHYSNSYSNPYLKNKLTYEDFKSLYIQKEPVLFPSRDIDAHTNIIWKYIESVCNEEEVNIDELQVLRAHETCSDGRRFQFNFSSSSTIKNMISAPHLGYGKNGTKAIANYRTPITVDMLFPGNNPSATCFTTFQQHSHGWNELVAGRKKWFLYRPGTLPSIGFNPYECLNHWLKNVYPALPSGSKPIEIVQEEGHVLYVPEGWYHASIPLQSSGNNNEINGGHSKDTNKSVLLRNLLTTCGGHVSPPIHGDHNNTFLNDKLLEESPFTLSVQQEQRGAEVIRSEYYHKLRGINFLSDAKYESAIDSFLQGVARGANVEEVDMTSTNPFSTNNDHFLVYQLGLAYAAMKDFAKSEKSLLSAISLNRLDSRPRIALVELYLTQHLNSMARLVLSEMDSDNLTHPEIYIFKYLSNFEKSCALNA